MISSTSNAKVKRLAALISKAKLRREEQVFIVEGVKMFREAPPGWIKEVYISEAFLKKHPDMDNFHYEVLSDEIFKKVSDTQTPQGVLCVLSMPHYELTDSIEKWISDWNRTKKAPLIMILEDLQDPGNLGTIIRTGEGAGVSGIIMTRQTADIFNPKVIRSTMGSIYRMPFFIIDNMADTIKVLKERGISVYAAHLGDCVDYDAPDYTGPTSFLIGNEGNGLKQETAVLATQRIKIPMEGHVESLNAAAAAAVLMYEAHRQKSKIKDKMEV